MIDGGSVVAVATGVTTGIVLAPETNNFVWAQQINTCTLTPAIPVIKTLHLLQILSNFTDMLLYVSMDTKEIKKKTSNNKNLAKYE